ncbi:hypothetical protein ACXWRW_10575, partial [Streptococcus pyogenes]
LITASAKLFTLAWLAPSPPPLPSFPSFSFLSPSSLPFFFLFFSPFSLSFLSPSLFPLPLSPSFFFLSPFSLSLSSFSFFFPSSL